MLLVDLQKFSIITLAYKNGSEDLKLIFCQSWYAVCIVRTPSFFLGGGTASFGGAPLPSPPLPSPPPSLPLEVGPLKSS